MRGKQAQEDLFESPYAMTVLPARGKAAKAAKAARKAEQPATAEQPEAAGHALAAPVGQPFQQTPAQPPAVPVGAGAPAPGFAVPTAPAFPPPPQAPGFGQPMPQAPGSVPSPGFGPPAPPAAPQAPSFPPPQAPSFPPPQTPGFPPAPNAPAFGPPPMAQPAPAFPQGPQFAPQVSIGFSPPADFAPDAAVPPASGEPPHHHYAGGDADASESDAKPSRRPSKRLAFLAIPLILVIGAAAYLYLPKLLHHAASAPTVALPAAAAGQPKWSNPQTGALISQAGAELHKASPLLANATIAPYGKGASPTIIVAAGLLPSTADLKTPAQQINAIGAINKALPNDNGSTDKLVHVPWAAKPGQLWCASSPADADNPAGTDCIYVDRYAVVIVTVYGTPNSKNLRTAQAVIEQVEVG